MPNSSVDQQSLPNFCSDPLAFVNIAGYKFVTLHDLPKLRTDLKAEASRLSLKGTILLSKEGINLFVAGLRENIAEFCAWLRNYSEFADLEFKESLSDHQPFSRLLVRLKKEIIAFGIDEIAPAIHTSRKLQARELKQWLTENKPVTLLDVRNDYEVAVGTFENALPIGIDHFRDFPHAVKQLPTELKEQPIVMFCTGGIRCEKAGPFMEQAGFTNIFQLDGGILKYFEEVGGEHYIGDCFVFDKRVALRPDLSESETRQCYACQAILSKTDCESPLYQPPSHCPYCYVPPVKKMLATIEETEARIREVTQTLPGGIPYDNVRPMQVSQKHDGLSLIEFLVQILPHLDEDHWAEPLQAGRIRIGEKTLQAGDIVRAGQRILHHVPMTVEPDVNPDIRIIHDDEAILAVNKPAPLPIHPCGRFNRNTLVFILGQVYKPYQLRPAHRIDAHTTGLVLFSKSKRVASLLQPQFADGRVKKIYMARVRGNVAEAEFSLKHAISIDKTERGGRKIVDDGLESCTYCRVIAREPETTLLEVHPGTGRTHQIRLHLSHMGHPICGDTLYDPLLFGEEQKTLFLHAWKLQFQHPLTQTTIELLAPPSF
ncbi:MAG TPA: sulfurtransferase [Pirellulaceae bacterium]|nr:sulfurtransferase [Pirellulaceae bacterium]HMO93468.1 sulfurtransferase [Pirellulaceae bacterium]HMP69217.1 sulfurtransferase [Pirellulaceae bacterium]